MSLIIRRVFVNGRSRPVVMENMRLRIDRGDIKLERLEAIKVTALFFSIYKWLN
jgi:hypothetical protein